MTLSRAYEQEISGKQQTQLGSRKYTYLVYNSFPSSWLDFFFFFLVGKHCSKLRSPFLFLLFFFFCHTPAIYEA